MDFKKIMVVGCGRSGTLYMTKVLKILGFEIGHEKQGKDGMASWFHSFGQRQKNFLQSEYKKIIKQVLFIHLVRNPLKVIESIYIITNDPSRKALQYYKDLCPDYAKDYTGLNLAVSYWVNWNKLTEKRGCRVDYRLKVEDITEIDTFVKLCEILNIPERYMNLLEIKRLGKKTHSLPEDRKENLINDHNLISNLTYEKLKENIDYSLLNELEELSEKYGYVIKE